MPSVPASAKLNSTLLDQTRFIVSVSSDLSSPTYTPWKALDEYGVLKDVLTGLADNTTYYVGVETSAGVLGGVQATFTTPPSGAHSFSFCAASCASNGSNAYTYENIEQRAVAGSCDFFIHLGDLHYEDISTNDEALFHAAYDGAMQQSRPNAMWRALPVLYMWDDHDYGPDDSDRDSPSRAASVAAYRNRVPTPPLAQSGSTDAPYYSWVRSRVRFIFTDVRSERAPKGAFATSSSSQVVFTTAQRDWLFAEFDAAVVAGEVVIWINTFPWIGAASTGADHWGGYDFARQEVANYITTNSLAGRIAILSGDMHALAYDDGTNAAGGVKVMHAAAIDRTTSSKGGPYTTGPITASTQQYGLVDVTDTGTGNVGIRFRGYSVDASTGAETLRLDESFDLIP